MNLIADIGNTFCKIAVVDAGSVIVQRTTERFVPAVVENLLAEFPVRGAIVCSTRGDVAEAVAWLRERVERFVEFTPETPVPIANAYLTPKTLGRDRLAAAVGAAALYPGRNVLIADFGTAVTVDLVTADNTYRGGCISPGLGMRFRALYDYTARLPLCSPTDERMLAGRTTDEAVTHGVMNSLAFEIEGYIARAKTQYENLCVIFTGGDANFFVKRIKNTIFANYNLVFCGLDRILEYNASEEHLD